MNAKEETNHRRALLKTIREHGHYVDRSTPTKTLELIYGLTLEVERLKLNAVCAEAAEFEKKFPADKFVC